MSDRLIRISIDVTQIDKARFVPGSKPNRAGKIPQYCTLEVWLRSDGEDDYGNAYFVKQSSYDKNIPPKDREQMPIIGNGKIVLGEDDGKSRRSRKADKPADVSAGDSGDMDVPF